MDHHNEHLLGEMAEYAFFNQELLNMDIEGELSVLVVLAKSLKGKLAK